MTTNQWISLVVLAVTILLVYAQQIATLLQDDKTRSAVFGKLKHIAVFAAVVFALSQFVGKREDTVPPRPVAVDPVAKALSSAPSSDKAQVASVYRALADVTQRDNGRLITSTAVWRAIHSDALRLAVGGTDLVGKYPGLDAAVEEVMAKHFPLDNKPLDPELVAAIVAACRDVEKQSE